MGKFPEQTAPAGLKGYELDERRTDRYTFTTMKGLIRYFSSWLDAETSNDENRLQLIKKCEYILVRKLRESVPD